MTSLDTETLLAQRAVQADIPTFRRIRTRVPDKSVTLAGDRME